MADTPYRFRIVADTASGPLTSDVLPLRTRPNLADPPVGLSAVAVSTNEIHLAWTGMADATAVYRIERSVNGGAFSEIDTVASGTNSYRAIGLNPDTRYDFKIRATNGTQFSPYSAVAYAITDPRPQAPSTLAANALSNNEPTSKGFGSSGFRPTGRCFNN
jgi:hypothetical protein